MYVSRAVRSIREDPIEGESVALALTTADDADPDAVASAAEAAGAGFLFEEALAYLHSLQPTYYTLGELYDAY